MSDERRAPDEREGGRRDRDGRARDESETDRADGEIEIALIAAIAANGVIGRDGDLPWHYPADLKHFKETTMGHPVIMGRRTFESILDRLGEPLPGRTNVVLTTGDLDRDDVIRAGSIEAAIDAVEGMGAEVAYVIGGASVYEALLPRADRLVLTEIDREYEGDTYFPDVGEEWTEVAREDHGELAFVEYARVG